MKSTKNISNLLKIALRSLVVAGLFVTVTNCTTEDEIVAREETVQTEETVNAEVSSAQATSLTVSGSFVEYKDGNLCSECAYVVPEDETLVDGAKLGIKPGSVICLNSAFQYKAIEIVNVDGTAESPVIIANCGE